MDTWGTHSRFAFADSILMADLSVVILPHRGSPVFDWSIVRIEMLFSIAHSAGVDTWGESSGRPTPDRRAGNLGTSLHGSDCRAYRGWNPMGDLKAKGRAESDVRVLIARILFSICGNPNRMTACGKLGISLVVQDYG